MIKTAIPPMFLRLALGIGFLSAVADRLGGWGAPNTPYVAWRNWENFISYTAKLNFNAPPLVAQFLGSAATVAEFVLGIALIVGFKIRWAAWASGVLLLLFAVAMTLNTSIKSAFDYSVLTAAAAAFLLANQTENRWSLDAYLKK